MGETAVVFCTCCTFYQNSIKIKRLPKNHDFSKIDFLFETQKHIGIQDLDLKPSKMNFLGEIDIKNTKKFCSTPSGHKVMLSPSHETKMY